MAATAERVQCLRARSSPGPTGNPCPQVAGGVWADRFGGKRVLGAGVVSLQGREGCAVAGTCSVVGSLGSAWVLPGRGAPAACLVQQAAEPWHRPLASAPFSPPACQVWWSLATVLTPIAARVSLPVLLLARAAMGIGEGVAMPAMNNLLSK